MKRYLKFKCIFSICLPFLKKKNLFIFGRPGSSLLHVDFLLWCAERGPLSSCGAQASHCGGFSCCRARACGLAGFSSCSLRGQCCSSWALGHSPRSSGPPTQLLQGVWDSPTPGSESLSLAPAGEFFTTEPPGKSLALFFIPLL